MAVFALVPAAGFSRRMGRPKLGLPLGDRTVLEHVIAALRQAEVEQVLVVSGPHVVDLEMLAQRAGATVLQLTETTKDMRATIEEGLRWLEQTRQPADDDAFLLCPADHPMLDPSVIRQIVAGWRDKGAGIVVPTFAGRRGHPTLIAWKHVPGIRAHPADQGLNTYLRAQQHDTLELPVASAAVLCDLDTPEDYERLRRSIGGA